MTTYTDVPLVVERDGPLPMAGQIAGQLREAVAGGTLAAGERLPSSRALARVLGVSRTVVMSAYTQLFAEGWLEGRHGSGTYVADGAAGSATGAVAGGAAGAVAGGAAGAVAGAPGVAAARIDPCAGLLDLRPGVPWAAGIDPAMWRRALRAAGRQPPSAQPDPLGLPALRAEAAGYLRRARGIACAPEQVLITRGVLGGLALLAAALVGPGDRVGIEEPGYPDARELLARSGAVVVPCRVDTDGIVVDDLPAGLRLLYTTPAHQYPLGGRLAIARRRALVRWARETGALVVEDDYDGEFRYDVAPLPSLHSLDPEVVVYLGTTSKVLTPALRTGWLAAAPGLAGRLAEASDLPANRVSEPSQHAVLAMLTSGDLDRHIRKMRLEYARRRSVLARTLGDLPGTRLLGDTAGMHIVLQTPPGLRPAQAAEAARRRGVAIGTLARYYAGPVTLDGLVLGYGAASLAQVGQAAVILRDLLASAGRARTADRTKESPHAIAQHVSAETHAEKVRIR
jgi:GntR family transcriptional regulator/MocR family aminotransferase